MGLRFGNDYLVFVATIAAPTTFSLVGGQQSGTFNDARGSIDGSHKTSGGFNLKRSANRDVSIDMGFIADLPDTGFTLVETAYNTNANIIVQIRDQGEDSVTGDAIWECEMTIGQRNVETPLNGVVSGSFRFEPAAEPTIDLTLA
jgi:hypothetical protein